MHLKALKQRGKSQLPLGLPTKSERPLGRRDVKNRAAVPLAGSNNTTPSFFTSHLRSRALPQLHLWQQSRQSLSLWFCWLLQLPSQISGKGGKVMKNMTVNGWFYNNILKNGLSSSAENSSHCLLVGLFPSLCSSAGVRGSSLFG